MERKDSQEEQIALLYEEMYPTLVAYARNILQELPLAEEAVQDTFCIACAKSDTFLQCENPKGWLMKTLKFVIKNTLRQQIRVKNMTALSLDTKKHVPVAVYDESDIDALYENFATREDFQLFKKIALDRYSMREAAEELGITVEACKKRVQRTRTFLRKSFSEDLK